MELKKSQPLLAVLLSILVAGLGQIYNGQLKKSIYFVLLWWIFASSLLLLGIFKTYNGIILLFVLLAIYEITITIDAFLVSSRTSERQLKQYNKWYFYILYVALIFSVSYILTTEVKNQVSTRAFSVPSSSMEPTIHSGDKVMVDTTFYQTNVPQRGDMVMFSYDYKQDKTYLSRIIGIEDDLIEIKNNALFLNGKEIKESYLQSVENNRSNLPHFGPFFVPKGKVFVMGDNRVESMDSGSYGPVSIQNLKGKFLYGY